MKDTSGCCASIAGMMSVIATERSIHMSCRGTAKTEHLRSEFIMGRILVHGLTERSLELWVRRG